MMTERDWLAHYFERYREGLFETDQKSQLIELKELFVKTQKAGKKVIFLGNGGSAAMASHCAVDFTKNAGIRCINFNEADLITCFANDYGYEKAFEYALRFYADPGDVAVLISSSGKSQNMVNAAAYANGADLMTVTFTGFKPSNPLKQLGKLNFHLESEAYNVIEMVHHIWLLAVCDLIIGEAEYPAQP